MVTGQEANDTDNTCHLIYYGLQILLLRRHAFLKAQRLGQAHEPANASRVPPILQPIIDLLQYRIFFRRVKVELDKVTESLMAAGIASGLRFTPVGETGQDLANVLDKGERSLMSGEALIWIDNQYETLGALHVWF
jgi:mediator of RNA polymerase II transcription subunit 17